MGDKTYLDTNEHYEFLVYILDLYNNDWENMCAMIGYNSSMNKELSEKMKVPFIGCPGHLFSLADRDILQVYEPVIFKINEMMLTFENLVPSVILRQILSVIPKTQNATKWSSCYEMVVRYTFIRHYLPEMNPMKSTHYRFHRQIIGKLMVP